MLLFTAYLFLLTLLRDEVEGGAPGDLGSSRTKGRIVNAAAASSPRSVVDSGPRDVQARCVTPARQRGAYRSADGPGRSGLGGWTVRSHPMRPRSTTWNMTTSGRSRSMRSKSKTLSSELGVLE